jgi:hypothetical protein
MIGQKGSCRAYWCILGALSKKDLQPEARNRYLN